MADVTTWTKRVTAWRASGLSADEFCKRRDLSAATLYWWSSRIRRGQASMTAPRLPRLVRVARSTTPSTPPTSPDPSPPRPPPTTIIVELAGARVLVPPGADAVTLSVVLDALGALAVAR